MPRSGIYLASKQSERICMCRYPLQLVQTSPRSAGSRRSHYLSNAISQQMRFVHLADVYRNGRRPDEQFRSGDTRVRLVFCGSGSLLASALALRWLSFRHFIIVNNVVGGCGLALLGSCLLGRSWLLCGWCSFSIRVNLWGGFGLLCSWLISRRNCLCLVYDLIGCLLALPSLLGRSWLGRLGINVIGDGCFLRPALGFLRS